MFTKSLLVSLDSRSPRTYLLCAGLFIDGLRRFAIDARTSASKFQLVLLVFVTMFACIEPVNAGNRVALVIGNGKYAAPNDLPNPANDATDVSAKLKSLGFTVVTAVDLTATDQDRVLRDFVERLDGAEVGLLYYSGHSMQIDGKNYLIPIDARLESLADIEFDTISLDKVIDLMQQQTRTNLVFLDACRNNPFAETVTRSLSKSRSITPGNGLARTESGLGTIVAFATQPGNVAADGEGRNSPFTGAFLKHAASQGMEIRQVLTRVRSDVVAATDGQQVPWDNSSLLGDFYLLPGAIPPPETPASKNTVDAFDLAYWNTISRSEIQSDYAKYLDKFPNGQFVDIARTKLERLKSGKVDERQPGFLSFGLRPPTKSEAEHFGLSPKTGAIIESVIPNSEAENAGIVNGSSLDSVNGSAVKGLINASAALQLLRAGDVATISLRTPDGTTSTVELIAREARDIDSRLRVWAETRVRLYLTSKKAKLYKSPSNKSDVVMSIPVGTPVLSFENGDKSWTRSLVKSGDRWVTYEDQPTSRMGYIARSVLKEANVETYIKESQDIGLKFIRDGLGEPEGRGYSLVYALAARAAVLDPNDVTAKINYANNIETASELIRIVESKRSYNIQRGILDEILKTDPKNTAALNSRIRAATEFGIEDKETATADYELLKSVSTPPDTTRLAFAQLIDDRADIEDYYSDRIAKASDRTDKLLALTSRAREYADWGECEKSFDDLRSAMGLDSSTSAYNLIRQSVGISLSLYAPCVGKQIEDDAKIEQLMVDGLTYAETHGIGYDFNQVFVVARLTGQTDGALRYMASKAQADPQNWQIGISSWVFHYISSRATTEDLQKASEQWMWVPPSAQLFLGQLTPEAFAGLVESEDSDPTWAYFLLGTYYSKNSQPTEAKYYFSKARGNKSIYGRVLDRLASEELTSLN